MHLFYKMDWSFLQQAAYSISYFPSFMGHDGAEVKQLTSYQKIADLVPAVPAHVSKCPRAKQEPHNSS